ncbi:MAG TPA: aldehyde dehydrogenase family protein [Actinomycetales bacterium]|nr:aldehyde dehydrogenase family protein [Actinomycetales bacterium]
MNAPISCLPWIGGSEADADGWSEVISPYAGHVVVQVARTGAATVAEAVRVAHETQPLVAAMPAHERAAVLLRAADLVERDAERFAATVTEQTGKALKNTLREVRRSALTFRAAAVAAQTLQGTVYQPDLSSEGQRLLTLGVRRPVGVIAAITPFNAPFNLVVHKVAPALAAGNAIVVKPADQAPRSAVDVARLLEEAGAPPGAVNVVPGDAATGAALVTDQRVRMVTFTGGRPAGEAVLAAAGLKRVTLELGGNSPNIVHHDAALEQAVEACLRGGFSNTGQSCNSVQRIIVHDLVADAFVERLQSMVGDLVVGDPADPRTDVGTLVDEASARRVEQWLDEARRRGARVLGGERSGAQLTPAVVLDPPQDTRVVCDEVFGPVVVVQRYTDLEQAIDLANSTDFGLQAAVFTASLEVAMRVADEVEAGAVLVNRSSNFRLDHLPYGGVKGSGLGREGPTSAVEEMTELRLVVLAPE